MRRPATSLLCSLLLLLLLPAPALAHASFDLGQVPADSEQTVELRVPIERDAGNDRIAVLVPTGFTVTDCPGAEGWSCSTEQLDDGTAVSLTRTDDGDPTVERFDLTLQAPTEEGTYAFPVVQTYDDGEEIAWVNEPESDRPAPRIQVGDAEATVEPAEEPTHGSTGTEPGDTTSPAPDETADDETTAPSPGDTDTSTPSDTDTPTPSDTDTPTPGAADAETPDDAAAAPEGDGDATGTVIALVLGGLLLAGIGTVVVRRRSA